MNLRLDFTHADVEFVSPDDPAGGRIGTIVQDVTSTNEALLIEEALRTDTALPVLREMFLEVMWALGYPHPDIPDNFVRDTFDEAMRWVVARSETLRAAFGGRP